MGSGSERLRFGLILPQGWADDLNGLGFEHLKRFAVDAEALGFDSLWAYDHFIPYREYRPFTGRPMLECWTLLSAIAGVTSRIRVGQVVTCNSYRSPALLAKMASTLDYISNGRLEFGIGAGWYEEEYVSYGYDFPSARVRIEQLDEALQIIRSMWVDEVSTFNGKHYRVRDAVNYPKPVQKPHPPIMVGGAGRMLLKVAARHADVYNCPFADTDELRSRLDTLKEHCTSMKRDYNSIVKSLLMRVIIADDNDKLRERIAMVKRRDESIDEFIARSKGSTIIGSPDEVAGELQGYASMGVEHFILHLLPMDEGFEESLRLLIEACKRV
ncbi:MAG: LLM class F420-dependent oxidoreductase [Candidatus Nitrosocaldus sp.]|nr:LLM class F420-dependent oxidoreductase [Candidatus Nitrosocaldus sp.]MDW8000710.1 LLM class F420-dependent oxidoreductase [Candidatus Nitrosocaldus sp.]